jgi:single-strand DNA-binding protein
MEDGSMANFNKVILMGNLTRDPQLKYLPNNTAVCEFGLAVNRRWRDRDGNQKDETCFVDISAFGRTGETINQYMSKGRPILIEGRLRYDSWTAQDGTKRSRLSVTAENFSFVGSRGDASGGGHNYAQATTPPRQVPAAPQSLPPQSAPEPYGPPEDVPPPSGGDIPF